MVLVMVIFPQIFDPGEFCATFVDRVLFSTLVKNEGFDSIRFIVRELHTVQNVWNESFQSVAWGCARTNACLRPTFYQSFIESVTPHTQNGEWY